MKKTILFLFVLASVSCFGQNEEKLKDITEITFYGTDFSKAKVYGAKETAGEFVVAFEQINNLFITEPKKYNIAKAFKKEVNAVDISGVKARIAKIDKKELFTTASHNELSDKDIQDIVRSLSIKEGKGTGLIFISEFLDKPANRGYYYIVFFDTKSREIIDSWKTSGKAQGFGLRNYWAGSIYRMMKDVKM